MLNFFKCLFLPNQKSCSVWRGSIEGVNCKLVGLVLLIKMFMDGLSTIHESSEQKKSTCTVLRTDISE